MAIFGYSGKPGAGKTYSVVEHAVIPALKAGRTVYHNLQLNDARLIAMCGSTGTLVAYDRDCTPDELVAGAPNGALVIVDESVRYWPSGTKANKVPKEQLEFFTMHRHRVGTDGRAMDIIVICQDFGSQCASFIRELIQFTYYSVKMSHLGFSNRYRIEVYEGVVKGDRPSKRGLVRKTFSKYRKDIYACYVSHTMADKGVAGEEIRDNRASVWKNWQVIAALCSIPLAVVSILLLLHGVEKMKHPKGSRPEHSEGPSKPSGAASGRPVVANVGPQESTRWRYAGKMVIDGQEWDVIDSDRGSKLIPPELCKRDVAMNVVCTVEGAIVAAWTGPAPPLLNQIASSASNLLQ